ncbi:MAG: DUF58 domain-containing protein [Planctomycetes bacterium]|nr:DUF58 domain-containing protein [Planctomycetota bacterium]
MLLARETLTRLERLVVLARRAPAAAPRRARRRPGRGVEPGARRDYAAGDDVRLIDWPAYARLERLLLKVVEALPEPRLDLLLDGSASMGRGAPPPHLRAALCAAALAACAVAREARVTLTWAGAPEARVQLGRPGELVRLLRFLAEREPAGPAALAAAAGRLGAAASRATAVVLTDGLDPPGTADAARRLRALGFAPVVVVCEPRDELDPLEAAAATEAAQVELVDAETGAVRRLPFAEASLLAARAARQGRARALEGALAAARVPLERLAADAPFEAVATSWLRRAAAGGV